MKKVFTVIGNVIIWLFVIFSAVITVFTFAAQSSEDGIPAIGSNAILTVSTDSMSPTFNSGDIIIGKKLAPEDKKSLKVDDVITFDAGDLNGDGKNDFNTHRIIGIVKDDNGKITSYTTKGDNNSTKDTSPVKPENVICRYTGTRIKGIGKVLNFLQTQKGFLICVVLPLILLFLYELIRFIRKYFELKGNKNEISAEEEERIRQQAVAEYLAAKGGQDAAPAQNAPAAETPAEEAPADEKAEEVAEAPAEETPVEETAEEAAEAVEESVAEEPEKEAEEPAGEATEEADSADEESSDE